MADPTYIGVPLPEYERRREAPTTEDSGGATLSPWSAEQTAADEERKRLLAESEVNAATAKAASDTGTANDVQAADDLLAEKVRQGELDRTAMQKSNEQIAAAREHVARKQKEFESYKPQNFFVQGDTWMNALRGLAVGLGDAVQKRAAVAGGHAAPQIDTVGTIIANDLKQSEAHIAKMKDEEAMARTGLADATDARSQLMADRKLAAASAYDRLASIAQQRKAAQGFDNNNVRRDEAVAAARAGAHKERQEAADLHASKVSKNWTHRGEQTSETFRNPATTSKGPTADQAKKADLSSAILEELKTIRSSPPLTQDELAQVQNDQLASGAADDAKGFLGSTVARITRGIGWTPRTKYSNLSENAQKSMNAWDSAVENYARDLTGAGMPEQEAIREARTLGYSPDDKPGTMERKIARLEEHAQRGISLSGQAGEIVSRPRAVVAPPPAAKPPVPTQPPPFVQPSAPAPAAAAVPTAADPRSQAIQLLKSGKVSPGLAPVLQKRFGIKPEELQ